MPVMRLPENLVSLRLYIVGDHIHNVRWVREALLSFVAVAATNQMGRVYSRDQFP